MGNGGNVLVAMRRTRRMIRGRCDFGSRHRRWFADFFFIFVCATFSTPSYDGTKSCLLKNMAFLVSVERVSSRCLFCLFPYRAQGGSCFFLLVSSVFLVFC